MVKRNEVIPADLVLVYCANNIAFLDCSDINGRSELEIKEPFMKDI